MAKNIFLIAVLIGLMLATAKTALTFESVINNAYCPNDAEVTLSITQQDATGQTSFEYMGNYLRTSDGESSALFVQKPSSSENWKFFTYKADLTIDTENAKECAASSTYNYRNLYGQILILQKNNRLYTCLYEYNSSATSFEVRQVTAPPTGGTGQWGFFYTVRGPYLYAWTWIGGVSSKICSYDVRLTGSPWVYNNQGIIPAKLTTNLIGNFLFIYSSQDRTFYRGGSNTWSALSIPIATTSIVKVFHLHTHNLIVDVLDSATLKTSKLYKFTQFEQTAIPNGAVTSATPIKHFHDEFYNFMQVNSENLVWVTSQTSENLKTTIIPKTHAFIGDTALILNVGLSKGRAVVLFSDKVQYWRHAASDNIQKYFQKKFTSTDITQTSVDSTKLFKLTLNCLCKAIDKMVCFAATLNCLIVKTAKNATSCVKVESAKVF